MNDTELQMAFIYTFLRTKRKQYMKQWQGDIKESIVFSGNL